MKHARHPDHDPGYAGHAFAAPAGRHPEDDALRAAGFAIHARPRGRDPIWRNREGALLTQREALAIVQKLEREVEAAVRAR